MLKQFTIYMPSFDQERKIHMYLPDSYYESKKRYPVLYMFDGHNLFDDQMATYGRSWRFPQYLENSKNEMIIVGQECSHQGNQRLDEYGPFPFYSHLAEEQFEGHGWDTMQFFIRTLKPFIDQNFRTKSHRNDTWIGGSSCGGLMAYYAGIQFSEVYSKAVCVSPYFHPTFQQLWNLTQQKNIHKRTAFYLSWGAKEAGSHGFVSETTECLSLANELIKKRIPIHFNVKPQGRHCEEDWEKEIPEILNFLWTVQ